MCISSWVVTWQRWLQALLKSPDSNIGNEQDWKITTWCIRLMFRNIIFASNGDKTMIKSSEQIFNLLWLHHFRYNGNCIWTLMTSSSEKGPPLSIQNNLFWNVPAFQVPNFLHKDGLYRWKLMMILKKSMVSQFRWCNSHHEVFWRLCFV